MTKGLDEVALILEAAGGGYFQDGQVGLDQELPGLSNLQVNNILHGRGVRQFGAGYITGGNPVW